jgi:ApaG protein
MKFEKITNDIRVSVEPEYLENQSQPDEHHFVWAYHVKIHNLGNDNVKLLNRYWKIVSETGGVQQVDGAGVVGVQPELGPDQQFEYTSGTHLDTPSGIMMGAYEMTDDLQQSFNVEIPAFSLDSPGSDQSRMAN